MKNYKVVSIADFTFNDIEKVEFTKKDKKNGNWIYKGDEFLCDKETFEYLNGNNAQKIKAINLIEIFKQEEPEVKQLSTPQKNNKKSKNR